ncbi:MAG: dienelactone hydrolase family protein [Kiloniellales bacterium]|nr:dienelactone hydrolase family protein [Kiloniellales bacterium]
MRGLLACLFCALAIDASLAETGTGAKPGAAAVEMTWRAARVGLPNGIAGDFAVIGRMDEARVGAAWRTARAASKVPMVVLLHGCSGIMNEEDNFLYLLTLEGYAVVMPDSFKRRGRRALCDVEGKSARIDPQVYAYRLEELEFALRQVGALTWVDRRRIYLIGFSEGGVAVAKYQGSAAAGLVIVGWHCQGDGVLHGLRSPESTPVLALIMENDPWYGAFRGRHCGQVFGKRRGSKSITLAGNGHAVLSGSGVEASRAAKQAILGFLRDTATARLAPATDGLEGSK